MNEPPDHTDASLSPSSKKESIPLPARRSPAWMAIAAVPVLLLAFVLTSFPARNSEVWQHLAAGRGLLSGTYQLGSDPFAYTTAGMTWVNHAWLYDVVLFLIHLASGERLVLFNALLASTLAGLLLLGCGWPRGAWTSLLSVALGLICLGPHLVLAPTMVSYLMLAFTLWWLERSDRDPVTRWSLRAQIPLLVAFVLWANCDEWFLLGPLAVGLYWLGSMTRSRPHIGWPVAVLSLAVCLLNPHHFQAFRLPSALVAHEGTTSTVDRLLGLTWPDIPVPLVAYVLLAVLSLLALLANRSAKSLSLAAVWVALLALSLYRTAAVPFFAIVACQVLATNWQAAREPQASVAPSTDEPFPAPPRNSWLEPLVASTALWALVVLACPGWLQGTSQPRSWMLRADPSMKRLAEQMAAWHEQGQLGKQSQGFNLSTDVAHYVEWFCPQEKVFFDGRANLFPPETVVQFQQIGRVLAPESASAMKSADWDNARAVLRDWQCTHLMVADPVDRRIATALNTLWQRPQEWTLVDLHGRAAMFVWRRPSNGKSPLTLPPLDMQRRAFDAAAAVKAPGKGIGGDPRPRPWWNCWEWSVTDSELERDEAAADIVHFEALRKEQFEQNRAASLAELAGVLLATVGPHNTAAPSVAGLRPRDTLTAGFTAIANKGATTWDAFALQQITVQRENSDQGPPGSLLLAVRAARRALHDNPDDALAHFRVGRACYFLQQQTMERGLSDEFPLLQQLRQVQAVVALKRAVRLRPDLQPAHELLANIFLESRGFDLALPHVQERTRLSKQAGPLPGESAAEFAARIEKLSTYEEQLGKQVRDLLNLADTQTFELGAFGKARYAESNGLPGYALEQLLRSTYAEFGREGAILELYLLLHAGRSEDFRSLINPDQEPVLTPFNYHWMQTLLAAADGNYDRADEHMQQIVEPGSNAPRSTGQGPAGFAAVAALDGLQGLCGSSNHPLQLLWPTRISNRFVARPPGEITPETRRSADLHCLRGMLNLESGRINGARQAFREAINLWNSAEGSPRLARHYLRLTARP